MGRIAFVLRAIAALAPAAHACEVYIPSTTAAPGSAVSISVLLTSGRVPAAVQFDLEYDSSALELMLVPADSVRLAEKRVHLGGVAGKKRVLIAGLNANAIASGDALRLYIAVSPEAAAGTYPIGISGAMCADPEGAEVASSATSGVISVDSASPAASPGVLSSASMLPGPVAPNQMVSIFGSGLVAPDGAPTTVLFDDVPAHLLYTGPARLDVVVPAGVAAPETVLRVYAGGALRLETAVPVADMAPGVFTQDASGVGPAVAWNEDGLMNTAVNPAPRGSVAAVSLTGLGAAPPSLSILVSGRAGELLDFLAGEGAPPGTYFVRFRIPLEVPPSPAAALVVRAGDYATQRGVTIAVQ